MARTIIMVIITIFTIMIIIVIIINIFLISMIKLSSLKLNYLIYQMASLRIVHIILTTPKFGFVKKSDNIPPLPKNDMLRSACATILKSASTIMNLSQFLIAGHNSVALAPSF